LLKFLAESRRQDLAYRMVMQPTCPSYGFMVDSGATAMWERFDGWHPKLGFHPEAMNGFNHLGMNSVFEWIFGYVAGIRPDWRDPAYKHFTVAPLLGGGLTSMKSHYDSIRGRIESAYELKDGKLRMAVTVPPNTTAAVILPAATLDGVTESGQPLAKAQGVAVWDPAAKTVCLQSGRYEFAMRRTKEPQ
jgi:alpha-L-rhamnosidase